MKIEIETIETAVLRSSPLYVHTAPSLRVPVTVANRTLLRWLRAAELSAWEAGRTCSRRNFSNDSVTLENQHV